MVNPNRQFVVDANALLGRNPIIAFDGAKLDGVISRTIIGGQTVDFDGNYGQFCRADVETETAWFPVQTPHTANTSSEPASTICFPMHPFLGIMDDHRQ